MKVTLPRVSDVSRAYYYYTNGRKVVTATGLSPDRTELRTRVREMLCICGVCDGIGGAPENRTLDGFKAAAVFGTVSSSMPDVLREKWLPELDSHQHALRHLINSQARLLFRHLGNLPGRNCTCDHVIRSHKLCS